MANKCHPKLCILITFGIMFIFIGLIMTIYGNVAKPFFEDSSWCDFCSENNKRDKENIRNTRIAGPIMLSLGIIFIVVACTCRKNLALSYQNNMQGHVIGYSSTGTAANTSKSVQQTYQQPSQPSYPPSQGPIIYPQQQTTGYPPQNNPHNGQPPPQQYTPMQQSSYLPNAYPPNQYPPGPPPLGQYPPGPPPLGQYPPGPPPPVQYPPGPPPGQFSSGPESVQVQTNNEKSGFIPSQEPPPPSYDEVNATAPPES